jgi:hypothetical protein
MRAPDPSTRPSGQSGQPWGTRGVFWLKLGSGKVALSRSAHQLVTQAVRRHRQNTFPTDKLII